MGRPGGRLSSVEPIHGPTGSFSFKSYHLAVAFVIGAILAKILAVKHIPQEYADFALNCGEIRNEQYGDKEIPIGQDLQLKSGSLRKIINRAENGTVILTFASSKYVGSLLNWLAQVDKLGINNYAIVCIDAEMATWLSNHKRNCDYQLVGWRRGNWAPGGENNCTRPNQQPTLDTTLLSCKTTCEADTECLGVTWNPRPRSCYQCTGDYPLNMNSESEVYVKRTTDTLWFVRWKLLLRLLNKNVNVLMADLDANFVRNPLPFLNSYEGDADLMAQRGTFPEAQNAKWGAALCMGFAYWRSTLATKRFTASVNKQISKTGDDQVGVNEALDHAGVIWNNSTEKLEFDTSIRPAFGLTNKGLRVVLLPHNKFPRKCEDDFLTHSFVSHCFEPAKDGAAKMRQAQKNNLWVLKEGYENVDVNSVSSFTEYLQLIRDNDL